MCVATNVKKIYRNKILTDQDMEISKFIFLTQLYSATVGALEPQVDIHEVYGDIELQLGWKLK